MNLQKLFELQRQLDERIEQEHPRKPGEDRLAKKILALLVELGELANEARFFKFWSNDQEPRTAVLTWPYGTGGPPVYRNRVLEEFVDGLHFILSLGLDIGFDPEDWIIKGEQYEIDYVQILDLFIGLGEMLGFTWEEIEEAYLQKNQENFKRQEEGY
jgi:dimeric dUTPase (all-alpha-NTP-PPase superfamily)